jgi:predicted dehydrogenase
MSVDHSRRAFLSTAAGSLLLPRTARSYERIIGANDRIQIGQIGCGHRAVGHRRMLKLSASTDPNFDFRSVCDLWTVNRQRAADHSRELFGQAPKTYKYSEEMLADSQLDAVMIATGDHQHARILAQVVKAGKDCYCEKPMANTIEDALLARNTVKASKQVVQMGSQWLSDPYQHRVRDIVRSGKLGKIVSINQSWNFNGPRWRVPNDKDIAAIREQDTDWKRWLLGRRSRPFDPRAYFEFRLYKDFSGGITDQWYSHGSSLAHFYLDTFIPDETVANGSILVWHDGRENPDTVTCVSTFAEKEVQYTYSTTFGNSYGDHSIIRGTKGTLYSPGGEGSPQWWFLPEDGSAWRSNIVVKPHGGKSDPEAVTIAGHPEPPPVEQNDDLKYHTDDWFRCMRNRKATNGNIDTGFAHAIAVIMATRSYREGRKMYWDRKAEQISYNAPALHSRRISHEV